MSRKFLLFQYKLQGDKAHDVPQGFIQKGGMYFRIPVEAHTPGKGCFDSVGFGIHKIRPATDRLSQHHGGSHDIKDIPGVKFFDFTKNQHGKKSRNDTAVYGKSPLPDSEKFPPFSLIIEKILFKLCQNKIQSCANHCDRYCPQGHIQKIVGRHDVCLCQLAPPIGCGHNDGNGNDDAIPGNDDFMTEQIEGKCHFGYGPSFYSQSWETNYVLLHTVSFHSGIPMEIHMFSG